MGSKHQIWPVEVEPAGCPSSLWVIAGPTAQRSENPIYKRLPLLMDLDPLGRDWSKSLEAECFLVCHREKRMAREIQDAWEGSGTLAKSSTHNGFSALRQMPHRVWLLTAWLELKFQ